MNQADRKASKKKDKKSKVSVKFTVKICHLEFIKIKGTIGPLEVLVRIREDHMLVRDTPQEEVIKKIEQTRRMKRIVLIELVLL